MNITPPVAMKFLRLDQVKLLLVHKGICPHCLTTTLLAKHKSAEIRFMQCSNCEVVVALEAQ